MFQNISRNTNEEIFDEDVKFENEGKIKKLLKLTFTIQNCIIYVLSFMVSMVGDSTLLSIAPFGFAMIGASIGAGIPAIMICLVCFIGTAIKYGAGCLLTYILTTLVFLASVLIKKPKVEIEKFEVNEQKKVGIYIAGAVLVVQLIQMFFKGFYIYDLLYSIMLSLVTFILYKIFVNALVVFKGIGKKSAFATEEVIAASLLMVIATNALGDLNIYNYSIRNIINILIVLILGWKNGMLIGGAGGITIGATIGIIQSAEPTIVAAYAISGLIAGLLNKLGKIGVIFGFIIGNILLSYISNGNTLEVIRYQEILIAALGLLAMPKNSGLKVEDLKEKYKLLPETTNRTLEENRETINKLNNMSEAISQIAKEYETEMPEAKNSKSNTKHDKNNKEIFIVELQNNLYEQEENLLYNDIINNEENILSEIFDILINRGVITRKDLILIFANHNNYILGFTQEDSDDDIVQKDVDDMVRIINTSYRVSKLNFIWNKKMKANKKTVSNQLSGVSEAISDLASQITIDETDEYIEQKEEIKALLKEKEIQIKDITIKQEEKGRYITTIYTNICDSEDGQECSMKKISKVLSKTFGEKMILQKQKCGLRENDNTCMFVYTSEDRYNMQIGIAKTKKNGSIISGDTTIQTRLGDGKYLVAISDGMGSGPDARKSSKIAIKMLERLLSSGFNKDIALKLINNTISANTEEDMYATLDVNILDLHQGNMEFIKNGACPTFLKRNKKVEILKSVSLPTGILDNVDLVKYTQELEDGDIILMCSDGILDSDKEFLNKELWIQSLLEDLETDDPQRISDIVLSESRDNDYGKEHDDMTVIVCRINKKEKA